MVFDINFFMNYKLLSKNVIILTTASLTSMLTSAPRLWNKSGDITILNYEPTLSLILRTRAIFQRPFLQQVVLLLCSSQNVQDIFTLVSTTQLYMQIHNHNTSPLYIQVYLLIGTNICLHIFAVNKLVPI